MRIAILSDIHDNIWTLAAVLPAIGQAEALVFCGDLCSPFVVNQLAEGYQKGPIHIVFGNNDGDTFLISKNASAFEHVQIHGELFRGVLGGKRFAVTHYPSLANTMDMGTFDVVCYGHDHTYHLSRRGNTLKLNPGPVMGYLPSERRTVPASFMIYDAARHEVEGYQLAEGGGAVPYFGEKE
ncbi:MAG: metallophosphoesterase family protein [Trueperaceae bacterium]|nr:MAG: metallophosphoesterase family protein [Trueperaceae bacterium]